MPAPLLLITALSGALAIGTPQAPKSGEDLIRLMYQRYAGKWYHTLTFVQKTTIPDTSKTPPVRVETWYEAARIPGYLRIDIAPLDSGKAIIFRNDTIYQVGGGKVTSSRAFLHPLLILGFDVYAQPVETTIEKLKRLNFDLAKVTSGAWQGKKVWIVGAADTADTQSPQFWVEQENLLFVRLLRPTPQGGVSDARFNKYVRAGNGWIAPEVLFFANGQTGTTEEYTDVRTNVELPGDLFDPVKFGKPGWVKP